MLRSSSLLVLPATALFLAGGCASDGHAARLEPAEGIETPPLRVLLVAREDPEELFGEGHEALDLTAAWLSLENRDPGPVGLARPHQLSLRDAVGNVLAAAIPPEDVVERCVKAGLTVNGPALLERLRSEAAPLDGPVPGGEARRGLLVFGRKLPESLSGVRLVTRIAIEGRREEPLVEGRLQD